MNLLTAGGTVSIADLTGEGGNLEGSQPLPVGAAKLTTDLTTAARAEVALPNNFGVLNDILETITVGFSWYKGVNPAPSASTAAAPSIKLAFFNPVCDETGGGDCFMQLIWEAYQNGNSPPTTNTWTREDLDADTGGWWGTGGFGTANGGGGCGHAPPCPTLRDWLDTLTTPDFGQATLVAISVGVGTYNPGQIGYFDKVDISGTDVANASYDFDIASFETVGECVSTLIADNCAELNGRARADCNHEQQFACFDLFDIP